MFVVADATAPTQQKPAALAVQAGILTAHLALLGGVGFGELVELLLVSRALHLLMSNSEASLLELNVVAAVVVLVHLEVV